MRVTWRKRTVGIAVAAACALALNVAGMAQAADPFAGTWRLDLAKSTYKPGPAPKSLTVVITAAADKTFRVAADGVDAAGAPVKMGYTASRDGKDVPVTGLSAYDTAALTQTGPNDVSIAYKKGGKLAMSAKASVSKDGKTMTVTYTGTDPKGQAINNVGVYVKQ